MILGQWGAAAYWFSGGVVRAAGGGGFGCYSLGGFFASIGKIFIFAGGLGTGLSFCVV